MYQEEQLREDVLERVIQAVRHVCPDDSVLQTIVLGPETDLVGDLMMDGHDCLELALDLEKRFHMDEIPDREIEDFTTIDGIVDVVVKIQTDSALAPH